MKITIELDTDYAKDRAVLDFVRGQMPQTADPGLQVSPVGDERPTITIHGPDGPTEVDTDDVDAKYAELQNQTLAAARGRTEPEPEEQPETVASADATPAVEVDVAAESQKARDLIIDACALPDVQVPDVIGMLKERNLPASTEEMKDHPEQIPAVIAALEGFVTSKKAASEVAIP